MTPELKPISNKVSTFIFDCIKPHIKWHSIHTFCVLIGATLEGFTPYFIKLTLDAISSSKPHTEQITDLTDVLLIFLAFRTLIFFVWQLAYYSQTKIEDGYTRKTRVELIQKVFYFDLSFFQNNFAGQIATKLQDAIKQVQEIMWTLCEQLLYVLILPIVGSILVFSMNPILGSFMIVWIILYVTLNLIVSRIQRDYSKRYAEDRTAFVGKFIDVLNNISAVKLFSSNKNTMDHITKHSNKEANSLYTFNMCGDMMTGARTLWHTVLSVGILFIGGYLWSIGEVTVASFAAVIAYGGQIGNKCAAIAERITNLFQAIGILQSSLQSISYTPQLKDLSTHNIHPVKGNISIDQLNFSYNSDNKSALQNLSLDIPVGQKIAIVGKSGAGKSTLVNLILRLYDPISGKICFDNKDIKTYTQESIRQQIAMIPQDTSLFHRSLMENIRYGRTEATDEEVVDAAKAAHVDEFIRELPEGYNTLVGERGLKLSGGQRQRIAIARALLKNAPILILDEATSALDSHSEELIQESLELAMHGKTVIAIAHRLSTIAHMDRIIVMDEGKIVEDGSHQELIEKEGIYTRLWQKQSGAFLP